MTTNDSACQVCGQKRLREVDGYAALPRITSDCRAYPSGGSLYVCLACGGVQKIPDARWQHEVASIYSGYEAYYQSGGDEQIVFDRSTGTPRRRSDVILANLVTSAVLPDRGRALDVGCGNGATLNAMSVALAGWTFFGYELGDSALPRLARISRFEKLHTGSLVAIEQCFDLVTMVHSLEHFPAPASVLAELLPIVGGGKLFIEVCNVDENPFDILVADHLMHFSPETLTKLLLRVGYTPVSVATDWVAKEISLMANVVEPGASIAESATVDGAAVHRRLNGYVQWLQNLREAAIAAAQGTRPFGLFGTSIAATWLAPQLLGKVSFFVDEDSSRIGREHLGLPIVHPSAVPQDAQIFLALAPGVASAIANRLRTLPCSLVMPPLLSD